MPINRALGAADVAFLLLAMRWTVGLALIALIGGGLLGLGVALARTAERGGLRWPAAAYVRLFQGTPLLMQLFLVYFGVSVLGGAIEPLAAAALGLVLNAAAFLGEIWRGCIQAVPRGQGEAAASLGLRPLARLRLVVLPQAARLAVAPTVGFAVQAIKNTSLAGIIGFTELARAGQIVNTATFKPLPVFALVAVLYFGLCWPLSRLSRRLEARLGRGRERGPA